MFFLCIDYIVMYYLCYIYVESARKNGSSFCPWNQYIFTVQTMNDFSMAAFFTDFTDIKADDLIDKLPVEKRHLSKLIIICRI